MSEQSKCPKCGADMVGKPAPYDDGSRRTGYECGSAFWQDFQGHPLDVIQSGRCKLTVLQRQLAELKAAAGEMLEEHKRQLAQRDEEIGRLKQQVIDIHAEAQRIAWEKGEEISRLRAFMEQADNVIHGLAGHPAYMHFRETREVRAVIDNIARTREAAQAAKDPQPKESDHANT